jgi:AcrR family transcriptional regulator
MVVKGDAGHRRTQAERRASTRAALLAAARDLFAEKGFAGAGREEIVERAGVTRGAMYHHFESKEALFQAVYEEIEHEVLGDIGQAAMTATDPLEQLRRGAMAYLDVAAHADVRRICLLDAPSVLPTEVRRQLAERYGLGLVRESLSACMAAGSIARQPVEPLAHVLLAALLEAATLVADGADRAEVDGVVERLLEGLR